MSLILYLFLTGLSETLIVLVGFFGLFLVGSSPSKLIKEFDFFLI